MKTKHTQGEWIYNSHSKLFVDSENHLIPLPSHFSCFPRSEKYVFGDIKEWQEAQANAKLMANAPKLLQGLIDLKSQLIDGGFSETSVTVSGIDVLIKEATE